MAPRPSLHQSLYNALQSVPTEKANPRTFELLTLSTKPFRTYTLFPHALDPTVSIMRTDYLIMLAEKFGDYRPSSTPPSHLTVPVFFARGLSLHHLNHLCATSLRLQNRYDWACPCPCPCWPADDRLSVTLPEISTEVNPQPQNSYLCSRRKGGPVSVPSKRRKSPKRHRRRREIRPQNLPRYSPRPRHIPSYLQTARR